MVACPTIFETSLTGQRRYRIGLFGKLILQVQEIRRTVRLTGPATEEVSAGGYTTWRDATLKDIYDGGQHAGPD